MNIFESFRLAWRGLIANKLRSALTMLGIIIGIFAVIVLISIGRGIEQVVNDQFSSIGSNLLAVFPIAPGTRAGAGGPPSTRGSQGLSNDDVEALRDPFRAPDIVHVAPVTQRSRDVQYGREETRTEISGITPEYGIVRNYDVADGSFITDDDVISESRVAVLGQTVVDNLFQEFEYPIGQTIRIDGIPFKIIGVLADKGGSTFGDENDIIFVPLSTAQRRLFQNRNRSGDYLVDFIYAMAASEEQTDVAADQLVEILREQHNIQFRNEDDFQVVTQGEILDAFSRITGAVTLFLGVIAAISLLVGGIGIMNIMLVSVTERTREIGLRKAVGAKRRDILMQFLIESMLLSVVGGVLGIALGATGSFVAERLIDDLTTVVGLDIVALATGVSAAIGVFFGIYPAYRAAGLNPIDALRYE